jgi:putative ABC transport system permease protein
VKDRGFYSLAARHLWERRGRAALTGLGIALGVALFVGSATSWVSVSRSLTGWLEDARGLADVVAAPAGRTGLSPFSPGGTGHLAASEVERLATLPGVESTAGIFALSATMASEDGRATELAVNQGSPSSLVGVDLARVSELYTVALAAGELPAPGSAAVVLTPSLAAALDVGPGEAIQVAAPDGQRQLTVAGVLEARGLGRLGDMAYTSVETAWSVAGRDGGFTQIVIRLADDLDAGTWIRDHQGAVGPGVDLQQGAAGIESSFRQLAAIGGAITILSLGVALVAGFLVHLTLSISVVERVQLYGLLYALGATRRQIRRVVVGEALLVASVASLVGMALGYGMSWALFRTAARVLEANTIVLSPVVLASGAALGVVIAVGSSMIPARRAAQLDPVIAIRGDYEAEVGRRRTWLVGAGLVVVGLAALASTSTAVIAVGLPLLLLGCILALPGVLPVLSTAVGRLTCRLAPGGGDVAVLHLVKERTRSAYTLGLVMVAMALAVAAATARTSFVVSMDKEIDRVFGADFRLTAASAFPGDFASRVAAVPGVDVVATQTFARGRLQTSAGEEFMQVRVVDPAYLEMSNLLWTSGDTDTARAGLAGDGLILASSAAERLGVVHGDTVTVLSQTGAIEIPLAATAVLSNSLTEAFVGPATGAAHFGVEAPRDVLVTVADRAEADAVASAIEERFAGDVTFIVSTADDLKADIGAQIDAGLSGLFFLLVMAGAVGVFGLANTLAVSMIRRFREIGLLRAIGARRRQVGAMALVESVTLVASAFLLAVPLGAVIARPLIAVVASGVGDLAIAYRFPWSVLPVLAGAGLVMGTLAALWPARRAASLEIDTALRFD